MPADIPALPLHESCPICAETAFQPRFEVDGFTIIRCQICTVQFVRQKMSLEDLGPYYRQQDFVYQDVTNIDNLNHYYRNLKRLIEARIPRGKVLDVGCARGQFLDVMEGWDSYGIEMNAVEANEARARYGDRIYGGTVETYPGEPGSFDCITLQDVLDHAPAPLEVLRACARLLRSGGLIVIKAHDFSCLYARLAGKSFYAIIPPYHLIYFNRASLTTALERTGFRFAYGTHLSHILWLKTVPYRLARGKTSGLFYALYRLLDKTRLGRIKVRKNLHDIITVFGTRGDVADSINAR